MKKTKKDLKEVSVSEVPQEVLNGISRKEVSISMPLEAWGAIVSFLEGRADMNKEPNKEMADSLLKYIAYYASVGADAFLAKEGYKLIKK